MKPFQLFSASLLAFAAASSSAAATSFVSQITVDAAAVNANLAGFSINPVGGASYDSSTGLLSAPVLGTSDSAVVGDIKIELNDAAGLKFSKLGTPSVTLYDFAFDTGTNELYASLMVGTALAPLLNVKNQSVLAAGTHSLSTTPGAVPSDPSVIEYTGSNYALSQSFKDYMLAAYELDANQFGYLASIVQSVRATAPGPTGVVPEPSGWVMAAFGLASVGLMMRRRQQQG